MKHTNQEQHVDKAKQELEGVVTFPQGNDALQYFRYSMDHPIPK